MVKLMLLYIFSCLLIFSIPLISFSKTSCAVSSNYRGDINEDDLVNIYDLLEMLKMLPDLEEKPEKTKQIADMDANGAVNIFDLLSLPHQRDP